ncbi:MAG: hypothetical protein C0623_09455 [Desulfuromonas sp.]|nr:MAG: hypothetical protein C0623_09455 [Desulfuromonas sp.]
MARNRTLQNKLEYLVFLPVVVFFRALPRTLSLRCGERLGSLALILMAGRRKLVLRNLSRSFPEKSSSEIETLCKKTFRHIGISVAEMINIDRFHGKQDLDRYFTFEGLEHLEAAKSMGRGVLLATGHVGFWEIGAFFLPELGFKPAFVAKKAKNPYINDYMIRLREHGGAQVIDANKGARQIVKNLMEGNCVGVLIDHHMHAREAVQVPFFDRPAWTTPIITQIAMKRNIPVIPIFVYRTEDFKYRVVIDAAIFLEGEINDENVTANTARLTNIIEDAIRVEPSQWFWVHKRWKQ